MQLSVCMEKFLRMCEAKNLATRTLEDYYARLLKFYQYAKSIPSNIEDVSCISESFLTEYIAGQARLYAPSTVRGSFVVLNVFFNYLERSNYIASSPMKAMKKPKLPKIFVKSFSKAEVQEILQFFDRNTFTGYRNYIIMNVLFGTGIRKGELLRISVNDVLEQADCLKVYGKGNKERFIPISPVLQRTLNQYLRKRNSFIKENNLTESGALFISSKSGNRLTEGGVNDIFSALKHSKRKWSTRVSAHTWRHTFAKFYLLNGGNIFSLQQILGHEDISTTRIYLDFNTSEVIEQNKKFNPLENTRWRFT